MSFRKSIPLIVAGAAAVLFSMANVAREEINASDVMQERQDNFEKIGKAFKTIRDEIRSGEANLPAITSSAETIHGLAQQIHTWFPEGTGPETGIETEAKAEIWQDKAGFNAAADKLVDASSEFLAVTRQGDVSAIGGGVRSLGGACKNCHDNYRVED